MTSKLCLTLKRRFIEEISGFLVIEANNERLVKAESLYSELSLASMRTMMQ